VTGNSDIAFFSWTGCARDPSGTAVKGQLGCSFKHGNTEVVFREFEDSKRQTVFFPQALLVGVGWHLAVVNQLQNRSGAPWLLGR
jgi:hypothetical protein